MRISAAPASASTDGAERTFSHPAFAPFKAQGAGFVLATGNPPQVVWANQAAASMFGADRAETLTPRLFDGSAPLPRRLRALATEGPVGGPPRLERLRLTGGLTTRLLTGLWVRPPGEAHGPLFGLAVLGPDVAPASGGDPGTAWRDAAPVAAAEAAESVGVAKSAESAAATEAAAAEAAAAETAGSAAAVATRAPDASLRARAQAALGGAETLRFRWRSDADDCLEDFERDAFAALEAAVPAPGASLIDWLAAFDPAGAARLRRKLADRTTWSGVDLQWPAFEGAARMPVVLGGSPVFAAGRRFAGYRGFGLIHPGRMTAVAPPPSAEAQPAVMAEALAEPGSAARPEPKAAVMAARPDATDELRPVEPGAIEVLPGAIAAPHDAGTPRVDLLPTPFFGVPMGDRLPPPIEAAPSLGSVAAQAEPRPDAAPHPAERTPASTESLASPVGPVPAANVLRFRPVQALAAGRFGPATEAATERRSLAAAADALPEALAAALPQPVPGEPANGALSASERIAFAEIARALGATAKPGPEVEIPPSAAPFDARDPAAATRSAGFERLAEPCATAEPKGPSHGLALAEALPFPVLVGRGAFPLFANRALLDRVGAAALADFAAQHPSSVPPFAALLPNAAASEPLPLELPGQDGAAVILTAQHQPIAWDGGPATLWVAEPPQVAAPAAVGAESAPPESSAPAELLALLDAAGEALIALDATGRILRINRCGAQWFGAGPVGPVGGSLTQLLAPESQGAVAALLAEVEAHAAEGDATPATRDVTARMADGATLPMRLGLRRHAPNGLHATLRDLSEQRRVERDLLRAEREAERASNRQPEFLAKVSHEIRTPLNAILGFAEVMMDERFGPLGNARYKDYLKDIHVSGTQVMSLVNDLLDLSRIEAGRLDLNLAALDLNKIIVECVATMQPQAHRERVIMRTSLGARLPPTLADERSTRQIVLNLLSNAVKFNEPGGQVIVSTALNDAQGVALRIRDTGIGMSDSDIAAALEPFRQLASSRNASGAGLGLPLTKALIGANGATLSIRSRPKEGTLVEVIFAPASAAARPVRVPA